MIRPTCCWKRAILLALLGGGLSWHTPVIPWMAPPGLALADDRDDQDESEDDRPAPVSTASLARSLRLGSIWVERSGKRLVAVRVGVERAGTLVATLTLHPTTLEPVIHTQRGLAQPRTPPSTAALNAALSRLSRDRITIGQFAVASAGGPLLPLYWGGRAVSYLRLDSRGQPRPDLAGSQALSASTLKVKR